MLTSRDVTVGIPTLSPQGAERALVLADLALEMGFDRMIVDNGGHFARLSRRHHVVPALPSVAASWNYILRCCTAPRHVVLLLNDDVVVDGAGLIELALEAWLSHSRWRNGRGPLELIGAYPHAFACFAMHASLLDAVGPFDEQFAPAYYEDTDYLRRMELVGVKLRQVEIGARHDQPGTTNRELGKLDWRANTEHVRRLFEAKWGTKQRPFKYPYNKEPPR